jgi:hypothetical protein
LSDQRSRAAFLANFFTALGTHILRARFPPKTSQSHSGGIFIGFGNRISGFASSDSAHQHGALSIVSAGRLSPLAPLGIQPTSRHRHVVWTILYVSIGSRFSGGMKALLEELKQSNLRKAAESITADQATKKTSLA